jgi:alkanesulfonate monooxygenase SsuD/methylene tetrahydromethanopterin reductase-like flavin-dependent oxidoreductase (luciferase family)
MNSAVGGTGLALPLNLALPVRGFVEVAQRAEAAGYDRLWAAEAGNNDAFGLLTAVALGTSRVGLATGVVPIYTRTPSLMAQCTATLQDVSGGRFTLGVGVSARRSSSAGTASLRQAARPHQGVRRGRPAAARLGEARPRRHLLRRARLHAADEQPAAAEPDHPRRPERADARAGGEVADGVCLNWIGAHAVADALAQVKAGPARRATPCFVRVCVTDDVDASARGPAAR